MSSSAKLLQGLQHLSPPQFKDCDAAFMWNGTYLHSSMQMPPGSLPRAMDVIIRNEMVERIRPGDKAIFTGSLIVIPDMGAFQAPGERTLLQSHIPQTSAPAGRGVSGIAATGSRELHYKLAFLANNIQVCATVPRPVVSASSTPVVQSAGRHDAFIMTA